MSSRKRRRVKEAAGSDVRARISKVLAEGGVVDLLTITSLRDYLFSSKDNDLEVERIKSQIDQKFITGLLCQYSATESEKDEALFDVFYAIERFYKISLRPVFPLVWGERAKDNYEKLRQLGQTLHTRLTSDQVLDYLDPKLMWDSLLRSEQTTVAKIYRPDSSQRLYDARFILRLLASLLGAGSEMSSRKFIDVNGLSFAFAATSFVSQSERCVAYFVLKRFLAHLMDLSAEVFPEKCLYIYLLQMFKNSVEKPLQRLPHVVAHFFARVTKLFLHPEDPVYQPVLSFLVLKPDIDLENVPEIYKLLMSSSTQFHHEERLWCLRLITHSLIEPYDYNVLQKRYGIKLFLSLFGSSVADMETRKYVLLSLRSVLQHRSLANDLYKRQNLHSWIVLTLQDKSLTRWESVFLCQLFTTLLKHVRKLSCTDAKSSAGEAEWRKNITRKTFQILGSKVSEVLEKENDDGRNVWLPKLKKLLYKNW